MIYLVTSAILLTRKKVFLMHAYLARSSSVMEDKAAQTSIFSTDLSFSLTDSLGWSLQFYCSLYFSAYFCYYASFHCSIRLGTV